MSLALSFVVGLTALVASGLATKNSNKKSTPGIVVGNESDLRVTSYQFNDAGSGYRDIWSASKIEAFLNKNSPVYASTDSVPGNVVFFGTGSELVDKGIVIDDNKPESSNVVWTSAKMKDVMNNASSKFMSRVPSATQGNLCTFDTTGQAIDSKTRINNNGSTETDIWTASKILSVVNPKSQMKLVPSASPKTIAIFDSVGQVQSSGNVIDDSAGPNPTVLWTSQRTQKAALDAAALKLNLVSGSKPNNWAMFDGSGQLLDSGSALNDIGKTAADVWSAAKIQSTIDAATAAATNSATAAVAAQTATCQVSIDQANAANTANKSALNTLSNDLKTKMNLVSTAKSNDIAIFDGAGQTIDSKLVFNDSGTTSGDIWSASKIVSSIASVKSDIDSKLATISSSQTSTNTLIQQQIDSLKQQETDLTVLLNKKMDLVPGSTARNVAIFNGSGQAVDGGFALDDSGSGASVIWSSAKTKEAIDFSAATQTTAINNLTTAVSNATTAGNSKMVLQPTAKANSLAVFNNAGQVIGSSYLINDTGTTANDLWTAAKINSAIDTRVSYTGTPVASYLAVWTSPTSVGDSKIKIDDTVTSTSNLWTAAQTAAFWDAQMLATYNNRCWFKGAVAGIQPVTSSPSDLLFNVLEAGPCTTVGPTSSVTIKNSAVYQVSLGIQLVNAKTAIGKYLSFSPTSGVSYKMPIFALDNVPSIDGSPPANGVATVFYNYLSKFIAGTIVKITVQFVNLDGTPATGATASTVAGDNVGNMFTIQQM